MFSYTKQHFSSEDAVSSMEIDSSANDQTNHKTLITSPDSYVSTTNEPNEPTSRAQVLEELRARIRELEGSPLKLRGHEEEHYKCYICKVSSISNPFFHPFFPSKLLCVLHSHTYMHASPLTEIRIHQLLFYLKCYSVPFLLLFEQDSKKPCPQCKIVTSSNELRKIHVQN